MKKNQVIFSSIKKKQKSFRDQVNQQIKKALTYIDWKKLVKGKKLFLKINLISSELVPGQCTSPWFLEAVLQEVTPNFHGEIMVGDANLAADKQCTKAAEVWGVLDLCEKYEVQFVNLSEDSTSTIDLEGEVIREVELSQTILEADKIINMPIAKTHCLSTITCCLKHTWGLLPRSRHNWHLVFNKAISDIYGYFKEKIAFNLVDATICMEENGPRTGIPKVCNAIFCGLDPVAVDSAVATYMGFEPTNIDHLVEAEKKGIGTTNYKLVRGFFSPNPFKPPKPEKQPIFLLEMPLRKVPILNFLIFRTGIFNIFAWGASQYNKRIYWRRFGKKYLKEIIENSDYSEEFLQLIKKNKIKI